MAEPFKIGDDVFTVQAMLGEESCLFQPRILPLVAELFALAAAQADSTDISALIEKAAPIVARACAKLPPEELRYIMRALLKGATMNGKPLYTEQGNPIDVLMRGRTLDIWRLLLRALEASYPDFFGLVGALRARAAAKAVASEMSTTSDPGSAGDS